MKLMCRNAGQLSDAYYQLQQPPSTEPKRVMGPTMPDMADLERRTEMKIAAASWQRKVVDKRFKAQQKETESEIAPRAEAGTRERKLEKKADVNAKMQSFREKSPDAAISQDDLMGKPDEYRTMLLRQKDRAQQRDDLHRAMRSQREKEMDSKREQARLKEERAMAMIREMARQKYDA